MLLSGIHNLQLVPGFPIRSTSGMTVFRLGGRLTLIRIKNHTEDKQYNVHTQLLNNHLLNPASVTPCSRERITCNSRKHARRCSRADETEKLLFCGKACGGFS